MSRISYQVVPPGRWKYKQGECWIYGDDWMDLIKMVKLHRTNNKITLGNVEKEVEDQLCELHPSIIIKRSKI